jgi:hypothetical protein
METVYLLLLPSLSAIIIKLLILWFGWSSIKKSNLWFWLFLVGLLGINVSELILLISAGSNASVELYSILIFYYLSAVMSSMAYLGLALQFAGWLTGLTRLILLLSSFAVALLLLVPGLVIAGVENIGYSFTRVPGPMYWVVQFYIGGTLTASLSLLAFAARKERTGISSRRAMALLIATSPTAICVICVVLAMQLGFQINATVLVSFMINILLAVLVYTEYELRLFRFLSVFPKTEENRMIKRMIKTLIEANTSGLQSAVNEFEVFLIQNALQEANNNKSVAADMLRISRATLRRKLP